MWVVRGSGGDRSRAPDVRVLFALPSSQAGPETSFVLLRAPLSRDVGRVSRHVGGGRRELHPVDARGCPIPGCPLWT